MNILLYVRANGPGALVKGWFAECSGGKIYIYIYIKVVRPCVRERLDISTGRVVVC